MQDWKKVQGSQESKPGEFDLTSSASVVYQRRNVSRVEVEDMDGSKHEVWQYEEREMTRDEYLVVRDMDLLSKIEYVAMMTDVDMEG